MKNVLKFYVNNFISLTESDALDVSFIPALLRRRLSVADKYTLFMLNDIFTEKDEYIVFCSRYGEVERLIKIINQYQTNKEVSPNTFSGSVHNYAVGFFLLNRQISVPYNAISSMEDTISIGLLTSVISRYNNVVLCYVDIDEGKITAFSMNLSKVPYEKSVEYQIRMHENVGMKNDFTDYIKLFNGYVNNLNTPIYSIERLDV